MTIQMNIPHPLVEDQHYLRHFWHPVCTLKELETSNPAGVGPIGRTLLGENVVIAKLNGRPVVMPDAESTGNISSALVPLTDGLHGDLPQR